MGSPENVGSKEFRERIAINMAMSRQEVVDALAAHHNVPDENILRAFLNLRNAPDDATITFTEGASRGVPCLYGEVKLADGEVQYGCDVRIHAVSGQPVQRIG